MQVGFGVFFLVGFVCCLVLWGFLLLFSVFMGGKHDPDDKGHGK